MKASTLGCLAVFRRLSRSVRLPLPLLLSHPLTLDVELLTQGLTVAAKFFDVNPVPVHATVSFEILDTPSRPYSLASNCRQGHSLGSAYASLAFAEILRTFKLTDPAPFVLRDLCTLGGPRVALEPLADLVADNVTASQRTWRICSEDDYVTIIPPPPFPLPYYPYVHYDSGMEIYENKAPMPLPSERGTEPPRAGIPWHPTHHCMSQISSAISAVLIRIL
jgi:hypothetical protein